MKKILSILLIVACVAGLALTASAATDRATAQKAIVETAFAYYYKELNVQYDSTTLTYQGKRNYGASRITSGASPEMAAEDYTVYTVCSDYCSDVYYNVFGYWMLGTPRLNTTGNMVDIPATNPEVAFSYKADSKENREEAVAKARALLQVGDVVVFNNSDSGHAMLYVGDALGDGTNYLIHSGGTKIDLASGIDRRENEGQDAAGNWGGSIRLDDVESCFRKDSDKYFNLNKTSTGDFSILRFMDAADISKDITPAALCRTKWPGLEIDRSGDRSVYHSVVNGEEMTVTLTIKNNGKAAYKALPVTETAPVGASIVEGSANEGGKAAADSVTWTVDIPAGAEKKLTYKVKITAKAGETVKLPAGMVDQIPSRELTFPVGAGKIAADAFAEVAKTGRMAGSETAKQTQLAFAKEVYKAVLNQELDIPDTLQELLNKTTTMQDEALATEAGGKMFLAKAPADKLTSMILPKHIFGRNVFFAQNDPIGYGATDRVLDLKASNYEPGDIFVGMRARNITEVVSPNYVFTYIYLGDGQVLARSRTGKLVVTSFDSTVGSWLRMNIAMVLRPSLVG